MASCDAAAPHAVSRFFPGRWATKPAAIEGRPMYSSSLRLPWPVSRDSSRSSAIVSGTERASPALPSGMATPRRPGLHDRDQHRAKICSTFTGGCTQTSLGIPTLCGLQSFQPMGLPYSQLPMERLPILMHLHWECTRTLSEYSDIVRFAEVLH